MKKYLITLFLLTAGMIAFGQSTDPLVAQCVMNAGPNTKYLKDFRIQLGKAQAPGEFRYKTQMSLWKNTRYKFSLCTAEGSEGELVLTIKNDANQVVLSSFDSNTGKTYKSVELVCNRSGIYQLNYDFKDGLQGSGVGVVSMVK
ncbi:MAG TPA: hypothetical protein PLV06_08495 [Bacteroidales bacterium]|nr:hypothetical protein [Bacteroidales bacterium]HPF01712.1 hypothetical protein [Bacteroidales bacterium]HPJ58721.1 hypothetical protein [Bacteroidales bacterium]HPR12408.1 hypothetical protein [Bacteroidales bacterium]HRW84628.1 hypothetical protein [Bacteroidales bacterium]